MCINSRCLYIRVTEHHKRDQLFFHLYDTTETLKRHDDGSKKKGRKIYFNAFCVPLRNFIGIAFIGNAFVMEII